MRGQSRYHLIGVIGDAGQGKTTYMTRHVSRELQELNHMNYDFGHLNIHTTIPDTDYVYKLADLEALRATNQTGIPREILAIDQIHKYANPRRAMSNENVQFNDIIIESRQHGFDLIFTTWGMRMVDPNVRKYVDLWVTAFGRKHPTDDFHYEYMEREVGSIGVFTLPFAKARKWWDMFDTTELVEDIRPIGESE